MIAFFYCVLINIWCINQLNYIKKKKYIYNIIISNCSLTNDQHSFLTKRSLLIYNNIYFYFIFNYIIAYYYFYFICYMIYNTNVRLITLKYTLHIQRIFFICNYYFRHVTVRTLIFAMLYAILKIYSVFFHLISDNLLLV